jgi:hypothetical protein
MRQLCRIIRHLGSGISRIISVADAHRDDGKRLVVRADEKLTALLELESAIHAAKKQELHSFSQNV